MDGKLLATGAGKSAYTWDMSVVLKEAGLNDLLLKPDDKSNVGATRRQGDWRRNPYPGPSNDTYPHFAERHALSPSSAHQQRISTNISSHHRAPPERFFSPSRADNDNAGGSATLPRFLEWARSPFSTTQNRRHDEGIELPERLPMVVEVPSTRGKPRIYSRREVEMKKEKEEEKRAAMKEKKKQMARDAKNAKNVSADSSRPSQSNATQQPAEAAQTPPTPDPHPIGVPTSSTTSVVVANSGGTARWTRFWSVACCRSTGNADGDH